MMMQLALDLVSFYSTFKESIADYIQNFSKDLNKSCKDNPNIEIVHMRSGFEDLYLPLFEDGYRANVDASHMIIRTDDSVYEMVNQGSTETEIYIHEINVDEDIRQNEIAFFWIGYCNTLLQREIIYESTTVATKVTFSYLQKIHCRHKVYWTSDGRKLLKQSSIFFDSLKSVNRGTFMNKVGHRTGALFTKQVWMGLPV